MRVRRWFFSPGKKLALSIRRNLSAETRPISQQRDYRKTQFGYEPCAKKK